MTASKHRDHRLAIRHSHHALLQRREVHRECIESVLRQTYTNFEYLLVNNCSKDNTVQIMHDYARRDSRIKVFDNTDFLDVMVNHNHAMSFVSPASK
jgi:cellulose synthase/poly-beta-1,6-N-acetylglucosamine synthase-like glycosyltransferase